MAATDISQAVVPLWAALSVVAGLLTTLCGLVVWVFSTFEMKMDAAAVKSDAASRHEALSKRVETQEATLNKVASDVSYIRGRMEPR